MPTSWIITANAGRVRVFAREQPGAPLTEVEDMVNTDVRLRTVDTETDQMGQLAASKSRKSVGQATQPSGYEPNQLPAEHQTELFGRGIAQFLQQHLQDGNFHDLTLVAAPQFLGVLRKLLTPQVSAVISREISKDYTQFSKEQLRAQLENLGHEAAPPEP